MKNWADVSKNRNRLRCVSGASRPGDVNELEPGSLPSSKACSSRENNFYPDSWRQPCPGLALKGALPIAPTTSSKAESVLVCESRRTDIHFKVADTSPCLQAVSHFKGNLRVDTVACPV